MHTHLHERLLRVGVAFSFIYPPISAYFNELAWIGYFPSFMLGIVSDTILLNGFGLIEISIALWILFGKNIYIPSILASVILVLIVAFNFNQMDVLFRDVSIVLMSTALVFLHIPKRHKQQT